MDFLLAIDQGTTSSRSIIFNRESAVVSTAQLEHGQIYPQAGWVEHDPLEIWQTQIETAYAVLEKSCVNANQLVGIGITNQRETTLIWEARTGKPIANAIVWQDRRTSDYCSRIRLEFGETIGAKTGLEVDAYFSASKINWLLKHIPGARERAEAGELRFGTIDSWLVWKLTNGTLHITDASNASRTMLYNINSGRWDDELLKIFDVPRVILPEIRSSSEVYGEVQLDGALKGVKILGIAGDQQAALFGQGCFNSGDSKNTYGTGCFFLQNTGDKIVKSKHRLLSTVAWQMDGKIEYALEGSVFIGGAVVQWLRDSLGVIENSGDVSSLANSVTDNGGVYFVPGFVGLGTPHWDQEARGMIIGLTRGTGAAHIARAAIESIAFQTADLIDAAQRDSGISLGQLRVDGGATVNESLMQFQADILQIPVVRSNVSEITALGAAYLAGLAGGLWVSKQELAEHWKEGGRFEPKIGHAKARELRATWNRAVKRALDWNVPDSEIARLESE